MISNRFSSPLTGLVTIPSNPSPLVQITLFGQGETLALLPGKKEPSAKALIVKAQFSILSSTSRWLIEHRGEK